MGACKNTVLYKNFLRLVFSLSMYPEPESNRHDLHHRFLRPTRLPVPPSGHEHFLIVAKIYSELRIFNDV